MSQIIESLPLFPLTVHVLPQGRLPLRIFEARYLRMVRESYHREHAFGMCNQRTRSNHALAIKHKKNFTARVQNILFDLMELLAIDLFEREIMLDPRLV